MTTDRETYATVDEVIALLQRASAEGYGEYLVGCNREYFFAKKDEIPDFDHKHKKIDFGGYC